MKQRSSIFVITVFYILFFVYTAGLADEVPGNTGLILPDLISDHMMLQQNKPIKLWGTAEPGAAVAVKLERETAVISEAETTAKENGEFSVELPAVTAGGPFTLTFRAGNDTVAVNDVFAGDIWVQSGQSNMERKTSGIGSYAQEVLPPEANNEIHLFMSAADIKGTAPAADLAGKWVIADPVSVNDYSAVGYCALDKLNRELDIPVGGICNAVGGASMEKFMGFDGESAGEYYYSKTAPLTQFNIRGIMWYQGEGDRGRTAAEFTETFNKLIRTWRAGWDDPELPFVYVTLPPSPMKYFANWTNSYIMEDFSSARLGQLQSYYENDNVAMAVAIDCPPNKEEDALHPNNKKPIGERLGLAALDGIYNVIDNGMSPLYQSATVDGNKAVIKFNYAYDGLKTVDGMAPRCFYVSESENGIYYETEAKITGANEISISCDKVSEIRYISYAVEKNMYPYDSADNAVIDMYADVNLINSSGLPACPFAYAIEEVRKEKAHDFVIFADIEADSEAMEAIKYSYNKGIMEGVGKNLFMPNDYVTRDQFAKMIAVATGKYDKDMVAEFSDVDPESWAVRYIASARNNGLMYGISDGVFGYGEKITYQDVCVVLYRAANMAGISFSESDKAFTGYENISEYAKEAVSYMYGSGMLPDMSDGNFLPDSSVTRAQAAQLLYSVFGNQ